MRKTLDSNFVATHGVELQRFFHEASLKGYASNPDLQFTDRPSSDFQIQTGDDGSTKIIYCRGEWRYSDKYFGGEPFSGMVVIRHRGIACFTMVYWGKVLPGIDHEKVYACLRPALRAARLEHPWRGPNQFVADNGLLYTNIWHGNIEKFYGQEKIGDACDNWLYEADYRGGIVNLR